MAPDKSNEARRKIYMEDLHAAKEKLFDAQYFDTLSIYLLIEESDLLKANYEKLQAEEVTKKCNQELGEEALAEFKKECDQNKGIFLQLRAKIQERIQQLKQKEIEQQSEAPMADDNITVLTHAKRDAKPIHKKLTLTSFDGQFNGSLNDWPEFQKAIETDLLDDSKAMNDEEKMICLMQACTPVLFDALKADGFKDAWEKMLDKFNDKYKLTQFFTHKLFYAAIPNGTSIQQIEFMQNEICTLKSMFDRLKMRMDESIVTVFAAKLDEQAARAWLRHRRTLAASWAMQNEESARNHMPTLKDFVDFLADELDWQTKEGDVTQQMKACSLQWHQQKQASSQIETKSACSQPKAYENEMASGSISNRSQAQTATTAFSSESYPPCILCDNGSVHPMYKCPKFLFHDHQGRINIVLDKKRCLRCLLEEHSGRCKDARNNDPCPRCKPRSEYHNSTLCPTNPNIYHAKPMQRQQQQQKKDDDDWSE